MVVPVFGRRWCEFNQHRYSRVNNDDGGAGCAGSLVYFAFVNYATLGYGDVLPVERWRLLGPLTAMSGMLLFGWSTAVIFEILRRTLVRTLDIND
jgi:ion channel